MIYWNNHWPVVNQVTYVSFVPSTPLSPCPNTCHNDVTLWSWHLVSFLIPSSSGCHGDRALFLYNQPMLHFATPTHSERETERKQGGRENGKEHAESVWAERVWWAGTVNERKRDSRFRVCSWKRGNKRGSRWHRQTNEGVGETIKTWFAELIHSGVWVEKQQPPGV